MAMQGGATTSWAMLVGESIASAAADGDVQAQHLAAIAALARGDQRAASDESDKTKNHRKLKRLDLATPWPDYILAAHEEERARLGVQQRPLTIVSLCTGLCAESAACTALGLRACIEVACDKKLTAQQFLFGKPKSERPKHLFSDVYNMLSDPAPASCDWPWHFGLQCPVPVGCDLLVAGFPCQPYSRLNAKRRKMNEGGVINKHPLLGVTSMMHEALDRYEPKAFIFENVLGFRDFVPQAQTSPLQ